MLPAIKLISFHDPSVATVNGAKIYLEDYQLRLNQKMAMLPKDVIDKPDYMKRFEEEVLDGMITEKIMYLRAQELNISISAAELEDKIKEIKKDYGKDFSNLLAQENVKYEQWKEDLKKRCFCKNLLQWMSMPTLKYRRMKPKIILMSTAIITKRNPVSGSRR